MNELYRSRVIQMFPKPDVNLTVLETAGTKILTREYGELTDFESGCWAAVLGHCRQEICEAMASAHRLFHTHQFFTTEHPGALVAELSQAAGLRCKYKGTFATSGSEAVSLATALAEAFTGRQKKLSFSISYLGALPELRLPRRPEQWLDLDVHECLNCIKPEACSECGKFAGLDFSKLAAFVFEPGNSGGLVLCPPDKLIAYLCAEVRRAGGCIIANEVTTGFGRTGKWFGFQHYPSLNSESEAPDFIALGKGLGNGYPISGVLVRAELAEAVHASGYKYLQSHTDDPLGCIIARKVVAVMSKEKLVRRGNKAGSYLRAQLAIVGEQTGKIAEIRGRGLMNVAVLKEGVSAKAAFKSLLREGFFTGYSEACNLIHMYPPLTIQRAEFDGLCTALNGILHKA